MNKHKVTDTGQALAYITDCTLATVCTMAFKKKRPVYEFERQINIAQTAIDWMVAMGVDVKTTRAADVIEAGGVAEWAKKYMPDAGYIP